VFAFDPSLWRVDISLDASGHRIRMVVHTDGQVVTPRERRYFEALLDELAQAICRPATQAQSALIRAHDHAISQRAARAALNENVAVTFGFLLSFPTLIVLLKAAIGVPTLWAMCWAFGGSLAIAYACLFSVKNRAHRAR
jgi:hypothetical protein